MRNTPTIRDGEELREIESWIASEFPNIMDIQAKAEMLYDFRHYRATPLTEMECHCCGRVTFFKDWIDIGEDLICPVCRNNPSLDLFVETWELRVEKEYLEALKQEVEAW